MNTLSTNELTHILKSAESIARSAGGLLKAAYHQPRQITHKGAVNLVTQADQDAEAFIVRRLSEQFPDHAILAEEGGRREGNAGLTWLIDPLDGTTNFAHAFPVFAVSIALHDHTGPLVGVVYDPLRDECFTAASGQGAWLNGQPIHVSAAAGLREALLATGFPYNRHTAEDNNTAAFSKFIRLAQGVRRAGAAALDLCYVACGRLDGYWEMLLYPWDVAAGILIVREAGGQVTSYRGSPDDPDLLEGKHLIASNGLIHQEMFAILQTIYGGSRPYPDWR